MALLQVNPTRMELTRLKRRLITARRGHKLLKDKRDELMKQFLEIMRHNRDARGEIEAALIRTHESFAGAAALMSPEILAQALVYPKQSLHLEMSLKNIMSVNVPVYEFVDRESSPGELFSYGFAATSGELDDALIALSGTFREMVELAQIEKTMQLLASEIEKTRRRVNALEYVMIPQLEETIKYITMKLEENERGNLTRLMKVKDMILKQEGYGAANS